MNETMKGVLEVTIPEGRECQYTDKSGNVTANYRLRWVEWQGGEYRDYSLLDRPA